MKPFSEYISEARKRAGFTQEQLAERLNVSKGAVGNWESGRNKPRPHQLRILTEILSLDTEDSQDAQCQPQPVARPSGAQGATGGSVVLAVMSDEGLKRAMDDFAERLSDVGHELRGQLMGALQEIDEEIRRRGK